MLCVCLMRCDAMRCDAMRGRCGKAGWIEHLSELADQPKCGLLRLRFVDSSTEMDVRDGDRCSTAAVSVYIYIYE